MSARRARMRGQTLIIFSLGFALLLFALTCLVADTAYLFRWSGEVQAAAQLAAQSGADAVDPRFLYGASQSCASQRPADCSVQIVDINPADRTGSLYAFERACVQSGDQSAHLERNPPSDTTLKTVTDPQSPEGTRCVSDGCRVFAVVTRAVALPVPVPGFPSTIDVRGQFNAAPVVGTTKAESSCTGGVWVPGPP
ncbi:MAG: hypothetical protein ABR498_08405 [Candidatus Dormibacteria bacterium]